MLSDSRKQEIGDLAEFIALGQTVPTGNILEHIARQNDITFSYGPYRNAFDGMLEHREGTFHIYLNLDRLQRKEGERTMFTFAHELGHYFIDEHRSALKSGRCTSHASFNQLLPKNEVEREADFFASCLLMPSAPFRNACLRRPLSSQLLADLAKVFGVSQSAAIFRYFQLNLFPMAMVRCSRGKVDWAWRTSDFRYRSFLRWKGEVVTGTTAAGEFFEKGIRSDKEETVYPDDWFADSDMDRNEPLIERCYYTGKESTLSLIWRKNG